MSPQERVILYDADGIPTASVDALRLHDVALRACLEMIELCEDQDAACQALIRIADGEGPASPLVGSTTLLALLPVLADVGRRLQRATGSTASLAAVIRGED